MKKLMAICLVAVMLAGLCTVDVQAKGTQQPGGIPAFLIGCCWGIREGTMWNDGSEMHWREWVRIVPFVNIVIGIWDGLECYQGMKPQEWAKKYSANWY